MLKRTFIILVMVIPLLITAFPINALSDTKKQQKPYGVFIGLASDADFDKLYEYSTVVIDAAHYEKTHIDKLHQKGVKVYSYLNIGSIEKFREYYKDFSNITLGDYENWPEEKWIDVSKTVWQNFVINNLAKDLVTKGIDGFFLDNLDIYYVYKKDNIYTGIKTILTKLNSKYKKPIIANGGYEFFVRSMNKKVKVSSLVYGINQECVFSTIDFEKNTFGQNDVKERDFVLNYLNTIHSKGASIYLTEYTKSKSLTAKISKYCTSKGFNYYISSRIELD